jgi:hypothetical protein
LIGKQTKCTMNSDPNTSKNHAGDQRIDDHVL